ncbi:MAG: response regulator transcription factor [Sphingomonadales bacterium]|nr:response regulator transcription factor [Sphingomonadales bacterium]
MYRICIVEDEHSLRDMIALNLELEGHTVALFDDGAVALRAFEKSIHFDLVILDVMLPNVSGFDLCKALRHHSSVPILFLSAKGTTADRVAGLKLGANDYLVKPFDLEELLLKVQILLKGANQQEKSATTQIGQKLVNFNTFEVRDQQGSLLHTFTKREVQLLELFSEKEGKVISRNEILDRLWGVEQIPTSRTIDNYILNFRKLFEQDPKNPTFFHSIRGVGYKFVRE